MASNFSTNASSRPRTSNLVSSIIMSSNIVSPSVKPPDLVDPTFSPSQSSQPFPSPSPSSSSPDFVPSSSSSTESSSLFSSSQSFSESYSSSTSSTSLTPSDVPSSTTLSTSTSSILGTALSSESTSAVTTHRNTLRPVEIAVIVLGVVTALLGFLAIVLIFRFRRKQHHPLYGRPFAMEKMGINSLPHVEPIETSSGGPYFRSLSEQKGTTPLLRNSAPNSSDLSHDESYREPDLPNHQLASSPVRGNPLPQFFPQHEISVISPSRTAPSQQFLSLTTPEHDPARSNVRSFRLLTQDSDALSPGADLAYADDRVDVEEDTPSIYSQPSANFRLSSFNPLSRGPSISSRVSLYRLSMPPTVLESIISAGSPIDTSEENMRHHVDTIREDSKTDSDETITATTRGSAVSPPNHLISDGLGFLNMDPLSNTRMNTGLERQNTTFVASLLKSRQRRSELLPTASSGVSHIERAESIRPSRGDGADVAGASGETGEMGGREPYGRRFRRMKAEQGN